MDKIPIEDEQFYELETNLERNKFFTIARARHLRVIERARNTLARNFDEGEGISKFVKELDMVFEAEGVSPLRPSHSKQVYRTNMSLASESAKEEFALRAGVKYITYVTARDESVRPNHAELDGITFLIEVLRQLGVWPPNGYQCRCSTIYRRKAGRKLPSGVQPIADENWNGTPRELFGRLDDLEMAA